MKILQFSCREGMAIDLRQAKAVLRHRPDFIIFEVPTDVRSPQHAWNHYPPGKKPLKEVAEYQKFLRRIGKTYPWVLSDVQVYENIKSLWKEGHDIKLYNVDAPSELLAASEGSGKIFRSRPSRRGEDVFFWIKIYTREKIMTEHLRPLLKKNANKNSTMLIFLQKFHWRNVQFQLSGPSKKALWEYYFGKFDAFSPATMKKFIREHDAVLYQYWVKWSDFD